MLFHREAFFSLLLMLSPFCSHPLLAGIIGGYDPGEIAWTNLASGTDGGVEALLHDGERLYVGGSFSEAGGINTTGIASWDGLEWSALGGGLNGDVYALAHDGTNLYVAGSFTEAGGVLATNIALWDGTSWTNLGAAANDEIWALAHDGTTLYAGGFFTEIGGVAADSIALWGRPQLAYPGVDPDSGSWAGGLEVIIRGSNLGNGTDITQVTLCGVSAAIQSQSATQLVVVAGAAPGNVLGDVRVHSQPTSPSSSRRRNAAASNPRSRSRTTAAPPPLKSIFPAGASRTHPR